MLSLNKNTNSFENQQVNLASLLERFLDLKKRYITQALFLRTGDLYYTFDNDALLVHRTTGSPLKLHQGHSMIEFNANTLDTLLSTLVRKAGLRVALAEELLPQQGEKKRYLSVNMELV